MRRTLPDSLLVISILAVLCTVVPHTPAFAALPHFWSQQFGDDSDQEAIAVATDYAGNVIIVGSTGGTVDFGGGPLTGGSYDIFVAKFNANGAHQWSKRFTGTSIAAVNGVAVDASGSIFIAGTFRGSVNFGGSTLDAAGPFDLDVFVAKFTAGGAHWWSKRFGDTSDQTAAAVAADLYGNVVVTGTMGGTVNFGGGNLTAAGDYDIFLAEFQYDGTHSWSHVYGDAGYHYPASVSTDAGANVVLAGFAQGDIDFGGGSLVGTGGNPVLAKFDPYGNHLWSARYGDEGTYAAATATTDASGNIFATGTLQGSVDFGGGTLVGAGQGDVYLVKFDPSGSFLWNYRYGDSEQQDVSAITTDPSGNVIISGRVSGTVNFGGGDLIASNDAYMAKFSPAGVHQASARFGDVGYYQNARGVAADATGNVFLTGGFQSSIDLGGGSFDAPGTYGTNVFLAKFGANQGEPIITSIVDIGNDQGRRVKIRFNRSGADNNQASNPVVRYDAFRRDDAPPAASVAHNRRPLADGWTQVGSVSAYGDNTYGIDVPTIADSTIADGQYYSSFFIRAATGVTTSFFDSSPDSGYSVDNLAPGVPTSFAYSAGALSWNPSKAEDFDYFSVYGSNTNAFGAATLIDYTVAPNLSVISSSYVYYFVTATDFSGNEGKPAVISTLSGIGETPSSYVLSVSAYPNPFNPATTIRYTVPSKGRVQVALYDLQGAHVVTLVDDDKDAGAYTTAWDGRAPGGVGVSSGVYFARVTQAGATKSYKLVLLK
jgi:hypothetical protein